MNIEIGKTTDELTYKDSSATSLRDPLRKALVIVDMQRDFIYESSPLPCEEANEVLYRLESKLKSFVGDVVFLRDTHGSDYFATQEGIKFPILHCVKETFGWEVIPRLTDVCKANRKISKRYIDKNQFGYIGNEWRLGDNGVIEICGTRTSTCVVSNALILKSLYPNIPIIVWKNLCADNDEKLAEAAFDVMRANQIEVLNYGVK